MIIVFFFLLIRPPPISTLFPYTTLFLSRVAFLSAQARGFTGFTAAAFTALADSRAGSTAISTATAFAAEVSLTRALSAEGLPAAKCMAVEDSTDSMAEGSTAAVTAGAADMINEPGGQNKKR